MFLPDGTLELIAEYDEIEIPPVKPYVVRHRRFACHCRQCQADLRQPQALRLLCTTPAPGVHHPRPAAPGTNDPLWPASLVGTIAIRIAMRFRQDSVELDASRALAVVSQAFLDLVSTKAVVKISPVLPSAIPRSVTCGPGLQARLAPAMALKVSTGGVQSATLSAASRRI